jgi:rod shape-determining protein MreC
MPLWEKRRSALVLAGLIAFHILLISLQIPQGAGRSYFERGVFFLYAPVQRLAAASVRGVKSIWTGYFDLRAVRRENQKLRREDFFLHQDIRFLEDRLERNEAEAELRASLAKFEGALVVARVIGVDSTNPHQSIVIDKGRLDGVHKDMAVCDRTGILVGRTIDPVGFKEAMVQLVTDKDSSVSVRSEGGLTGSVMGLATGLCELRYVLASAEGGKPGDELRTTGFDKIYPAGIRVGTIRSIERNEASPIFLKIIVNPYFNYENLDVVAVLTTGPGGGE